MTSGVQAIRWNAGKLLPFLVIVLLMAAVPPITTAQEQDEQGEQEESVRSLAELFRENPGLYRMPTSRHKPFNCSHFRRDHPPLNRELLAPGDRLTIDLCAGEKIGCDWDNQPEINNPYVLQQTKHNDLDKNKLMMRFTPMERFIFTMDEPGNSLITFTCRGDGGEVVRTHTTAVTVDPAAAGGEVLAMKPDGEVTHYAPTSTFWGYQYKCKMFRKGKEPFKNYLVKLFDRFTMYLCAADWLGCTWMDQVQISDTGVVVQYDHDHVPNPALRRNPEDRYHFQTIGEGSSELSFSCIDEEGEEVQAYRLNLNVGEERWAEIIPFRPKEEAGEEGEEAKEGEEEAERRLTSTPGDVIYDGDPCTHPNNYDRLDYVYYKPSGGGLTLEPTKAEVLTGWTYNDPACEDWDATDLSDHLPLKVTFDVMDSDTSQLLDTITLLNYNAHLFYGIRGAVAELFEQKIMIYQDLVRREHIRDKILEVGADIVALQEVWDEPQQEWFMKQLKGKGKYPYVLKCLDEHWSANEPSYEYGARPSGLVSTSGVMLFSKFPVSNIRFKEFPVHWPISLKTIAAFPDRLGDAPQDVFSKKGVLTVDVVLENGATFRLGVSHAHTDQTVGKGKWSKYYNEWAITTFNMGDDDVPYIFALKKSGSEKAVLARVHDYSWEYDGDHHDAGWKITGDRKWSSAFEAITSFEQDDQPYLFGLMSAPHHKAYIRGIKEGGTGWTEIWNGRWSSLYKGSAITSFQLNGEPYIFGLKKGGNNAGKAQISRIDVTSTGPGKKPYLDTIWRDWGLVKNQYVVSFELDGHPYLFEVQGLKARIARIEVDESTGKAAGWKYVFDKHLYNIPSNCTGSSGPLLAPSGAEVIVERIGSGKWGNDFFVTRAFELNGHPHVFSLKAMHGEWWKTMPGEGYITRINDDGSGWQHLMNLPHMQIIIDETIRDDAPAVMVGDFNVHVDHYGNMNRMFETFGALDAWVAVNGPGTQGAVTIDACNNPLTRVFKQPIFEEVSDGGRYFIVGSTILGQDISIVQEALANGSTCLDRVEPKVPVHAPSSSVNSCNQPYDRPEVTSITPFELNGQPHILVLAKKRRSDWDQYENMADIFRIYRWGP